jgi:hypothetical protein
VPEQRSVSEGQGSQVARTDDGSDLLEVAHTMAAEARSFLTTVSAVASGSDPGSVVPLLLLATSDLLAAGARLGAMVDVVPPSRFEPDVGPDTDIDPLCVGLATVLDGIDEYVEVEDPLFGADVTGATLSGDVGAIASALAQGLRHYEADQVLEALWWWQFSYLSVWGERASSVLRVVQMLLAHLRLDVEDDVAAEAEYDALQA